MKIVTNIDDTYKEVERENPKYRRRNLFKILGKGLGIGLVTTALLLPPKPVDAQTRKQRVLRRPASAGIIQHYPGGGTQRLVRRPGHVTVGPGYVRGPIYPHRPIYRPIRFLPPFYYSSGFYGYVFGGFFYPFGLGPYPHIGFQNYNIVIARQMFCHYWRGQWGVERWEAEREDVRYYQDEIKELKTKIRELEQKLEEPREPKIKEKEVSVYIEKEAEYHFGYKDGGMYPSQWTTETASYFNWYFNYAGNLLHAYSPGRVRVGEKSYDFDVVVRDGQGNPLFIFEFPDKGNKYEKEKMELIESGKLKIPAYVITPTSDRGPDFEKQLKPYKNMMIK